MDPVTAAIVAGAATGLTSSASQAVRDAYDGLKGLLATRFPDVDLAQVEKLPDSRSKQQSLARDVILAELYRDAEVVRLAEVLTDVLAREAPQAAAGVGVDLERVKGHFLEIRRVQGGVRVRHAETSGGITITDVQAGRGPDPN